ncbi:MAG TPA: ROK family protein [Longimicrobiaceae bacterium]|nr:ROK family protein [Longimicrobiaceae bacterium]
MRKINTRQFNRGTRSTPREINRKIVLNLLREHQPISRADLARRMAVGRGMITELVDELIADEVIAEGAIANAPRGRKPRLLHVRTRDRFCIAVDVRFGRTHVALTDLDGLQLALETLDTRLDPDALVADVAGAVERLLHAHGAGECQGMGVVVPGMIHRRTGQILNSPQLGWRDVPLREALARATGLRVLIENAPIACALARIWLPPWATDGVDNFVYVTVSDGVGACVVDDGEVFRGHGDTAGEFGHLPLSLDGPRCMCGQRGCLEAYTSNLATLARYFGLDASLPAGRTALRAHGFGMEELIARVRAGDARARAALEETGRYLGIGVAGIITALSPARVVIGGEITAAWDVIGGAVGAEVRGRAITSAAAATPIEVAAGGSPRLRGATALLVAHRFAAPKVA